MASYKKWSVVFISIVFFLLIGFGSITVIVDPFFHYHKPLSIFEYPINNQRYQNDGIAKHFDYDAMIIGSSMTENFKTTECDEIFGVNSIKIPYSGARYKEVDEEIARAIKANDKLKVVIRAVDYERLLDDKDAIGYDSSMYPTYLYDDFLFNDVSYVFNKTVLLGDVWRVTAYAKSGGKTPTFDEYCSWSDSSTFGKAAVDAAYHREEKKQGVQHMTEEDYVRLEENITQNVTALAKNNPQIKFYYFFPPYSIYYWDSLYCAGEVEKYLEAEKRAIELILECDNIYLYSFFDDFDLICNLDNYKDKVHYSGKINSMMLKLMYNEEHRLTKDNYEQYCEKMYDFYVGYDYDGLFDPE